MTTMPHRTPPAAQVTILNPSEWTAAVNEALAELKLSYDDLAQQAKLRDFTSSEARKLWLAIGGRRP